MYCAPLWNIRFLPAKTAAPSSTPGLPSIDQQMYLSATEGKVWHEIIEELLGYDPFLCPICRKGKMHRHFADDADPRAA